MFVNVNLFSVKLGQPWTRKHAHYLDGRFSQKKDLQCYVMIILLQLFRRPEILTLLHTGHLVPRTKPLGQVYPQTWSTITGRPDFTNSNTEWQGHSVPQNTQLAPSMRSHRMCVCDSLMTARCPCVSTRRVDSLAGKMSCFLT